GEQAEVLEKQRRQVARLTVNNILRSEMADDEKVKALEPWAKLGDHVNKVLQWYGERALEYGGMTWSVLDLGDCDLAISCGPDRVIHTIGHFKPSGEAHILATLIEGGHIEGRYHP